METLLYQYSLNPATWVYLSSLLIIALFFKFSRFFSVRNLDLIGLILLAPGVLLVAQGEAAGRPAVVQLGYVWLFVIGALFLVRLLGDPMMVRRPLLEPNLSVGGMTFLGAALLVFLMANVMTTELTGEDLDGPRRLDQLLNRQEGRPQENLLVRHGPGYPWLHLLPSIPSKLWVSGDDRLPPAEAQQHTWVATARLTAVLSHLVIVAGLVLIGYRHFDNIRTGIAVATLYLLLPCTAQMTGRIDLVLPAALLVWAIEAYRRPWLSGVLLGLAAGAIYYPLFLLPLWLSFYWQRGLLRFVIGFVSMLGLLVLTLALTSRDLDMFFTQVKLMFGAHTWSLADVSGFWDAAKAAYRIPVIALFAVISVGLAVWPAHKNLGTLLSCSAAVMLGTQFWHAQKGGLNIAWYLPLLLLTVFRPNLEDRVALSVLAESWLERRVTFHRREIKAA
jgi:hypothetical protein